MRSIWSLWMAYVGILLPIILYTGATGMMGILDVPSMLGSLPEMLGTDAETTALWLIVIIVAIYALFGGLRTVAVSDILLIALIFTIYITFADFSVLAP